MIQNKYITDNFVIQQFRTSNYRYEHGKRVYPETTFRYDGKHSLYTAKNGVGKSVTVKLLYSCLNAKRLSDTKVDLKTLYETTESFNNAMLFSHLGELYLLDVINYKNSKTSESEDDGRTIRYLICRIPEKSWDKIDLDRIEFSLKEKTNNGFKVNSINDFTSRLTSYLETELKAENIGDSAKINFLKYNLSELDRKFASLGINLSMLRKFYEDVSFSEGSLTEYFKIYNTEKKFLQEVLNPVLVQSYNHKKDAEIIQTGIHKIYSIDADIQNKLEEAVKFYNENKKNIEDKDSLLSLQNIIEKISKFVAEAQVLTNNIKNNSSTLKSAYTWAFQNKNKKVVKNTELSSQLEEKIANKNNFEYLLLSNEYMKKYKIQKNIETQIENLESEDNEIKAEIEKLKRTKKLQDAQSAWKEHLELSAILLDYQKTLDAIVSNNATEDDIEAIRYSLKLHFDKLLVDLEGKIETIENYIEDLNDENISIDLNKNNLQHRQNTLQSQIKTLEKSNNINENLINNFLNKIDLNKEDCIDYDENDLEEYNFDTITKHVSDKQIFAKENIKSIIDKKETAELNLSNLLNKKILKTEENLKKNQLEIDKINRQISLHQQIDNLCVEKHFIADNYPVHKTDIIKKRVQENIASLQIKKTKLAESRENLKNKELISYPVDFLDALDNEGINYELGKKYIINDSVTVDTDSHILLYGIIVKNEETKKKVLELSKGYHFSFVIPIIVANESFSSDSFISGIDNRLLENNYCSVKIAELSNKIDKIDFEICNLQNELDFISSLQMLRLSPDFTFTQNETLLMQVKEIETEIEKLNVELSTFKEEKDKIEKEIYGLNFEYDKAKEFLDEVNSQLEYTKTTLVEAIQKYEQNNSKILEIEAEIEDLTDSIESFTDDKIQINNDLNRQKNNRNDLKRQVDNTKLLSKSFEDATPVSKDKILNGTVAYEKWDNLKKSKQEQIEKYEFKIHECTQKMDNLEKLFYSFTTQELETNFDRSFEIIEAEIESLIAKEQEISKKIRDIQITSLTNAKIETSKIEQQINDKFNKTPYTDVVNVVDTIQEKANCEFEISNLQDEIFNNDVLISGYDEYINIIPIKYQVLTKTLTKVQKNDISSTVELVEKSENDYKECEKNYKDLFKQAYALNHLELYNHFTIACPEALLNNNEDSRVEDLERCQNDIKILLQIISDNTQEIELTNNHYENLYIFPIVDVVKDYIIFTDKKIRGLNAYGFKGDCKHTVFQVNGWHEFSAEEIPQLERNINSFVKNFIENLSQYEDYNDRKLTINKIASGWKNTITKIQSVVISDFSLSDVSMYLYIKKTNGVYEKCRWTKVPSLASGAMCFAAGLTVQLEISKLLSPDEKGLEHVSMPIFLDNPGATVSSEEYLKEIFNCLDQHNVQLLAVAPPENEKLYAHFPRYYALTLEESRDKLKQNIVVMDNSNYNMDDEVIQEVTTQVFNIVS